MNTTAYFRGLGAGKSLLSLFTIAAAAALMIGFLAFGPVACSRMTDDRQASAPLPATPE